MEPEIRMVVDWMNRWARIQCPRNKVFNQDGYQRSTLLGRIMDGMPMMRCTGCRGKGKVQRNKDNEAEGMMKCPTCNGTGQIKRSSTASKVDSIPFPKKDAGTETIVEQIDAIIARFKREPMYQRYYFVLDQEYRRSGTQLQKAERMRISDRYYRKLLREAHNLIYGLMFLQRAQC